MQTNENTTTVAIQSSGVIKSHSSEKAKRVLDLVVEGAIANFPVEEFAQEIIDKIHISMRQGILECRDEIDPDVKQLLLHFAGYSPGYFEGFFEDVTTEMLARHFSLIEMDFADFCKNARLPDTRNEHLAEEDVLDEEGVAV